MFWKFAYDVDKHRGSMRVLSYALRNTHINGPWYKDKHFALETPLKTRRPYPGHEPSSVPTIVSSLGY